MALIELVEIWNLDGEETKKQGWERVLHTSVGLVLDLSRTHVRTHRTSNMKSKYLLS